MSDTRLNAEEKALLKSTIGKALVKYRHDPFAVTPSFTMHGEVFFEGLILSLWCDEHPIDFFESGKEGVSSLSVRQIEEKDAVSALEGVEQIDFPVGQKVKDVLLVEESIQEFVNGVPGETYRLTRGIVFVLEDIEIGFEKDVWLSVEIYPHKGKNVAESFDKLGGDLSGWPKGCMSKNERVVYSLSDGRIVSTERNETGEDPCAD